MRFFSCAGSSASVRPSASSSKIGS
jgi:hypothetical protein